MKTTTKEKIYTVLAFIGIVIVCAIVLELVRWFMWACYYAGIPM